VRPGSKTSQPERAFASAAAAQEGTQHKRAFALRGDVHGRRPRARPEIEALARVPNTRRVRGVVHLYLMSEEQETFVPTTRLV
jgi:hypothetical protein